jgi:hypothetical protein
MKPRTVAPADIAASAITAARDSASLRVEGRTWAWAYLDRVHGGKSAAGDLATVAAFLQDGPMLQGFCDELESALKGAIRG